MDNQQESTRIFPAAAPWPERLANSLRTLWRQIASRSVAPAAPQQVTQRRAQLALRITTPGEQRNVLCVALIGALNHVTYEGLIETVIVHYQQGNRRLVLDLRQTTEIKLSGLFALVNIARLYSGQPLLDPEDGWLVIGQAAAECTPDLARRVKLLAPSRSAESALRSVRYGQFFERHADLSSALAAFPDDEN
ncbi:MAG: hypothetical protein R2873_00380 [Caldilineaceae bacterium]